MKNISAKTLTNLQWPAILSALAARAKTDLGRGLAERRPFLTERAAIEEELAKVGELAALASEQGVGLPSWGVRDLSGPLERAAKGGVLEPPELLGAAAVLHALLQVRDFVEERQRALPRAWNVAQRIAEVGRLASRLERAFDASGQLADHASPELGSLRDRLRGLHRSLKNKVEALLRDENFTPLLQEHYFTLRNDRYVLPVLASARSQVPGIVHNASQSGQTLFIEPQVLVGMGNELAIAQSLVLEEERRILGELSGALGREEPLIRESLEAAALLDATEAAARLGLELDCTAPRVVEAGAPFRLIAMRHPILSLQGKSVVPNDTGLAEGEAVLVISGPNAGGKTVSLTGVGLCALMLRSGLPVPCAEGSTLPLFDSLETAIGDDQDMSKDLSTFSAHLKSLKEIGLSAGPGALILVDEIAADTDPREGAAIALAVLESYTAAGARSLVTTHLEELKAIALTDAHYVNARVGFDPVRMAPTYKLQLGMAGSSSAIEVARRMGLPPALCDRAQQLLDVRTGPLGRALAKLEEQRRETELAQEEARRAKAETERRAAELESARAAVRERERAIEAEARAELLEEIEAQRREVAKLLAELQARPSARAAVEAQERLAKVREEEQRRLAKQQTEATAGAERAPEGTPFKKGMRVRLAGLGDATLLELEGDEAVVMAGAMKLRRKLSELTPLKGTPRPTGGLAAPPEERKRQRLLRAEQARGGALEGSVQRLDVRGMRAEEAMKAAETFLDRCYSEGCATALIQHGLGTGALRATIREWAQRSPYVGAVRAAPEESGGEGTTLIALKG